MIRASAFNPLAALEQCAKTISGWGDSTAFLDGPLAVLEHLKASTSAG